MYRKGMIFVCLKMFFWRKFYDNSIPKINILEAYLTLAVNAICIQDIYMKGIKMILGIQFPV